MAATIQRPFVLLGGSRPGDGTFYGINGQTIVGNSSGAWTIAANGTNQNIALTASGTGSVVITANTVSGSRSGGSFQWQIGTSGSQINIGANGTGLSTVLTSGAGTTALTLDSSQTATFAGALVGSVQQLSGAGAVGITTIHTSFTSTGAAQALTLANGTSGQVKTITHIVDGGSGVLTPTTALGYTTITFTNAGDSVTLRYTSAGWAIVGIYGAVAA